VIGDVEVQEEGEAPRFTEKERRGKRLKEHITNRQKKPETKGKTGKGK